MHLQHSPHSHASTHRRKDTYINASACTLADTHRGTCTGTHTHTHTSHPVPCPKGCCYLHPLHITCCRATSGPRHLSIWPQLPSPQSMSSEPRRPGSFNRMALPDLQCVGKPTPCCLLSSALRCLPPGFRTPGTRVAPGRRLRCRACRPPKAGLMLAQGGHGKVRQEQGVGCGVPTAAGSGPAEHICPWPALSIPVRQRQRGFAHGGPGPTMLGRVRNCVLGGALNCSPYQ